jgi:hypothetical protein
VYSRRCAGGINPLWEPCLPLAVAFIIAPHAQLRGADTVRTRTKGGGNFAADPASNSMLMNRIGMEHTPKKYLPRTK